MLMTNQSGQAVLIVLLGMAVVLTVVLSILAASTSDIKISSNSTESLRAFSAAEAGIEKALSANSATSGIVGNAQYNVALTGLSLGKTNFVYPSNLASGDSGVLWFVSHASDGTLICDATHPCFTGKTVKICWGLPGTASNLATTPAIELSVFYLTAPSNYTTVKVAKATYDPNAARLSTNSFSASDPGTCTIGQNQFAFQKTVDLSTLGIAAGTYNSANGLQFMPVRLLYNAATQQPLGMDVTFPGDSTLPSQGTLVDSTGNLNASTRKIEVTKAYNQVPSVFEAAIFSPGGLSQ